MVVKVNDCSRGNRVVVWFVFSLFLLLFVFLLLFGCFVVLWMLMIVWMKF